MRKRSEGEGGRGGEGERGGRERGKRVVVDVGGGEGVVIVDQVRVVSFDS